MLQAERRQLRHDFGLAPELVDRYFPEKVREDALTMIRQVNGVTTYLSWMATGEPRLYEGTLFATAIAGMDVLTDEYGEPLADGAVVSALGRNTDYRCLEPCALANREARGPRFDEALLAIAEWQDASAQQFGDLSEELLWDITSGKGGASALAHLHAVKEDPSAEEEQFMFRFGTTMQLLDDYLDQPADRAAGISTLFTEGHRDGSDLRRRIERFTEECRCLWGDDTAVDRFGQVMRLHHRLATVENSYPGAATRLLPWYF